MEFTLQMTIFIIVALEKVKNPRMGVYKEFISRILFLSFKIRDFLALLNIEIEFEKKLFLNFLSCSLNYH